MPKRVTHSLPKTKLKFPARNKHAKRLTRKMSSQATSWVDTDLQPAFRDDTEPFGRASVTMDTGQKDYFRIPERFRTSPLIHDSLQTKTSIEQDEVVDSCLPFLSFTDGDDFTFGNIGIPKLDKRSHVKFAQTRLLKRNNVLFDSQRPFMIYWCLTALYLLGENPESYRDSVIATISPCQNLDGGFGGGHGQFSHVAATYASILSLAIVGGAESLKVIDRRSLWRWLGKVKARDGGFHMSLDGEEDVRGAYCAMVIITLLALPFELPSNAPSRKSGFTSFTDGLPQYLSRCQTFEGGISGRPQSEAQGAHAYLVLACLCMLGPPHETVPKYLDLPLLISWLAARQYAPEGGFSGRTNKLVDICYSHWVGSCWPIIEAALNGPQSKKPESKVPLGGFFCEEGLTRFILSCCQDQEGGLKDKPFKLPDPYHTCYGLVGLSSAQHRIFFSDTQDPPADYPLNSALGWNFLEDGLVKGEGKDTGEWRNENNRVKSLHPIYVIPWEAAKKCYMTLSLKSSF